MIRFDRSSLLAAGLLLVTLLFGVVGGVAIDRWLLRPGAYAAGPRSGMPRQMGESRRFDPARLRSEFSGRLARELDLSAEQRALVDSIVRRQQLESRAVMREMAPRLQRLADSTRAELRGVLTPEQWERMQVLQRERRRR